MLLHLVAFLVVPPQGYVWLVAAGMAWGPLYVWPRWERLLVSLQVTSCLRAPPGTQWPWWRVPVRLGQLLIASWATALKLMARKQMWMVTLFFAALLVGFVGWSFHSWQSGARGWGLVPLWAITMIVVSFLGTGKSSVSVASVSGQRQTAMELLLFANWVWGGMVWAIVLGIQSRNIGLVLAILALWGTVMAPGFVLLMTVLRGAGIPTSEAIQTTARELLERDRAEELARQLGQELPPAGATKRVRL